MPVTMQSSRLCQSTAQHAIHFLFHCPAYSHISLKHMHVFDVMFMHFCLNGGHAGCWRKTAETTLAWLLTFSATVIRKLWFTVMKLWTLQDGWGRWQLGFSCPLHAGGKLP